MTRFRPQLWPTLFTIAVVAVLLGLGTWQLERRQWKRELIAEREAAVTAPPVAPPPSLAIAKTLEFHRVSDAGVLLHDKALFLNATGPLGAAGFQVLTPLREASGRTVFINRGFIPTDLRDPAKRQAGELSGNIRITGLVRVPPEQKPGWFLPDNRADTNYWFWIDLPAMAAADGLSDTAPFYIDADATPNPGGWPKGGITPIALANDHLQYAITWFSLAAAALVIYTLSQRRPPEPGINPSQ